MTKEVQEKVEEFFDGLTEAELMQVYAALLKRMHKHVKELEKERAVFNAN